MVETLCASLNKMDLSPNTQCLAPNLDEIWQQFHQLHDVKETKQVVWDESICLHCKISKVYSHELPVCPGCGRVDFQYLSDEPEWIGDEDGPDPSRCGMANDTVLFSEKWGMGTIIHGGKSRMAMINAHSAMNHKDRALFHSYVQLDSFGKHRMGLPDTVMNQAKIIYKKFSEDKLTRGAVRNGIKAHCVLAACKLANVSRSYQEVANAFDIPVKDISRTAMLFTEVSGIETGIGIESNDLVSRVYCDLPDFPNKNKIKMKIIRACELANDIPELMSKTPKGILSAVMYKTLIENGIAVTRDQIADLCGVSLPTLLKIEKLI